MNKFNLLFFCLVFILISNISLCQCSDIIFIGHDNKIYRWSPAQSTINLICENKLPTDVSDYPNKYQIIYNFNDSSVYFNEPHNELNYLNLNTCEQNILQNNFSGSFDFIESTNEIVSPIITNESPNLSIKKLNLTNGSTNIIETELNIQNIFEFDFFISDAGHFVHSDFLSKYFTLSNNGYIYVIDESGNVDSISSPLNNYITDSIVDGFAISTFQNYLFLAISIDTDETENNDSTKIFKINIDDGEYYLLNTIEGHVLQSGFRIDKLNQNLIIANIPMEGFNNGITCVEINSGDVSSYSLFGLGYFNPIFDLIEYNSTNLIHNYQFNNKKLIEIRNIMGAKTNIKPNTPLIYFYGNRSLEKKVIIK